MCVCVCVYVCVSVSVCLCLCVCVPVILSVWPKISLKALLPPSIRKNVSRTSKCKVYDEGVADNSLA